MYPVAVAPVNRPQPSSQKQEPSYETFTPRVQRDEIHPCARHESVIAATIPDDEMPATSHRVIEQRAHPLAHRVVNLETNCRRARKLDEGDRLRIERIRMSRSQGDLPWQATGQSIDRAAAYTGRCPSSASMSPRAS